MKILASWGMLTPLSSVFYSIIVVYDIVHEYYSK